MVESETLSDIVAAAKFSDGRNVGFGVFSFKNIPIPFIVGGVRREAITKAAAISFKLDIEFWQTHSRKKAWENMASQI
ncbi:MAG: hypothetical protein ACI82I_003048 [Gammaproteobacteria bacterium]